MLLAVGRARTLLLAHLFNRFPTSRPRYRARVGLEALEPRLNLSTFIWTGLGDGQTWNDAANWYRAGSSPLINQPTVPPAYSDVVFPPKTTLPAAASTTIDFNFAFLYMPLDSITIEDAYTFTGNPVKIESELSVSSPFGTTPNATTATILLSGLELAPGVTINASGGSTLQLGSSSDTNGVNLTILGGITKTGAGGLVIDTSSILYTNVATLLPIPVTIIAGSITLGATANLNGLKFQVNSAAGLEIADNVAIKIQGLYGSGLVDLEGTTAANDQTSLNVAVPIAVVDTFDGFIDGTGAFVAGGNGTLSTRTIDFSGSGSLNVMAGTLDLEGPLSIGDLVVYSNATLGGLGLWTVSGPIVFQPNATFDVTLAGTEAGSQYTQLVDTDATAGINLGYANLAASFQYEYEQADQYAILKSPVITGAFSNVVAGKTIVDVTVPVAVTTAAGSVTVNPLQSLTATQLQSSANPSNPGAPVTFTATSGTRTTPASAGSVSFVSGSTVVATVPVGPGGIASWTTSSLLLGKTTIVAVYSGAGSILGSTSAPVVESVVPYVTVTTFASATNPTVLGAPVTLEATVTTTTGIPVISGSVSFQRGWLVLGTVPLTSTGTASLVVTSLPVGSSPLQAVYSGTPDDLTSVSPLVKQVVGPAPTATVLTVTAETLSGGRTKYVLVATVGVIGEQALLPSGTVIFRENGRSIGAAKIRGGAARLVLRRKPPSQTVRFVASFQKNTRFRSSLSPAVSLAP
jgi:hypothetical protein